MLRSTVLGARSWIVFATCLVLCACEDQPRRSFFASCGEATDCESGVCSSGVCTRSCVDEGDCGEGVCVEKVCVPVSRVECSTDQACAALFSGSCRTATCSAGHCAAVDVAAGSACSAGCDGAQVLQGKCGGGQCLPVAGATPKACSDDNPCTIDTCDARTGCRFDPAALPCDDGDECTVSDTCVAAACKPGAVQNCSDSQDCTTDTCTKGQGCQHAPVASGPCSDGDACTLGDTCAAGKCQGGGPRSCDDGQVCTGDSCDKGTGCVHGPATGGCDDGDACTKGDACAGGKCLSGPKISCDDNNACSQDACAKTSGCSHAPIAGACDDGSVCTVDDVCKDGACLPGEPTTACADDDPCTNDGCDPVSGCVAPIAPTATCDDGDACTTGDNCASGGCAGKPATCDDGNPCTKDSCQAGKGCEASPVIDGGSCGDGQVCVSGKCVAAACKTSADCDDGNACTSDLCELPGGCQHPPAPLATPCDDGSACTKSDNCSSKGVCAGTTVNCDDANACTSDACDPKVGCTHESLSATCDDGSACTGSDACKDGLCKGKPLLWTHTYGLGVVADGRSVAFQDPVIAVVGTAGFPGNLKTRVVAATVDDEAVFDTLIDQDGGTDGADEGEDIAAVAGGWIVAGATTTKTAGGEDGWFYRLDAGGKKVWTSTVGTAGQDHFRSVYSVGGGKYAAAGFRDDGTAKKAWLVGVEDGGKVLFDQTYSVAGKAEATALVAAPGGGLLLAGVSEISTGVTRGFAVRVDASGTLVWSAPYGEVNGVYEFQDAVALADGYAFAGVAPDVGKGSAMWLVRTDLDGKVLWQQVYAVAVDARAWSLAYDGTGFALGGQAKPAAGQTFDLYGVRTDKFGNFHYSRTEALVGQQNVRSMALLPDGGVAMAGATDVGSVSELLMGRSNAWGVLFCGAAGKCVTGSPKTCDDGNPCTTEDCTASAGCVHAPLAGGSQCGSEVCFPKFVCENSTCGKGAPADCDDGNPCTTDGCGATGCTHALVADGMACPGGSCQAGKCQAQ